MTFRETEISFDEEIQRLEDKREELAEEAAQLEDGSDRLAEVAEEGQEIDTRLAGVRWARDAAHKPEEEGGVSVWDHAVDAVTLAGLTGGEFGALEDELTSAAASSNRQPGQGASRVHLVAKGTIDAPYLYGEDGELDEDTLIAVVSQLPITYLKWAEAKVDELTSLGGNGQDSFGSLVRAKRAETSDAE